MRDDHDYNQNPASFKQRWMDFFAGVSDSPVPSRYRTGSSERKDLGVPFMVSEFGGTVWGDTKGGWGYGAGPKNLDEFYQRYEGLVDALLDNPDMFGFCYTQLTDVEQEHNGLYFYDRTPKFDAKRLHAITSRPAAFETSGPKSVKPATRAGREWQVLVGAAVDGELSKPYQYTTAAPAADWMAEAFNDDTWKTAKAPFGTVNNARTPWTTPEIWLRRKFDWNGTAFKVAALVIQHDEDTEVFVNGEKIWSGTGFNNSYDIFTVTEALKKALKNGSNTLAVHTRQTVGGQFIDLALLCEP